MMNTKEVNDWFEEYDNPMKPVLVRVREVMAAADERMGECIKWQAPTFSYKGNMATFNPRSKKHASLMFHQGAEIPGDHPVLEGDGKKARTLKFADLDDVEAKVEDIEKIVKAWCDWRDEQ